MAAKFTLRFYDPPVLMTSSDSVKASAPVVSAASGKIRKETFLHEIVRARVDWEGSTLKSDVGVSFAWYNADLGKRLYEFSFRFKAGWSWGWVHSWIGHLPLGEIDRPGNYYVMISAPGLFSKTLPFTITEDGIPKCPEGTYRCSPDNPNIRQKCVDGAWVDWQSCSHGCDPETGECKPAPFVPEPELPTDITAKLIGLLKDILFEGVYVQDALVKWDILPAWVGTIFNKVIDFLSINVAPEGERPLRIMIPGGSFITKQLPKISAGVADDIVKQMIREGAEKLTAKIAKSPAKMAVSLKRLPESALIKLFQGLSASPVGRIAIFNIVKILDVGGAEKAAIALAKSELTEAAAKSIFTKVGPEIGKKFYKQAGKPKRWESYPKAWKWWLGLGGAIVGYATMNLWLAKEAVWEAPLFPIADLIRDEQWEIADEEISRLIAAADFYEKTIKTLGWLSPVAMIIYKRGLKEIRANIALWRSQIDAGLAKAPPPIPPPLIPPVAPPEEPPDVPPEEVSPTEPPEERVSPTADKAYVTITSKPAGASIWIDGKNTWTVTPFAHLLDQGNHNLQLQLFRHHSVFQNITVIGGQNMVKSYEMKPLAIEEEEKPFIPLPIEVPLVPVTRPVTKPTAWEYTITAKDADTGEIVSAKIIVNGIYTGKYTTNNIILEPEAEYSLRLEAFGYEPGEFMLTTEPLPE